MGEAIGGNTDGDLCGFHPDGGVAHWTIQDPGPGVFADLLFPFRGSAAHTQAEGIVRPPAIGAEFAVHFRRELNHEADALANQALDGQADVRRIGDGMLSRRWDRILLTCDGASRGNPGPASLGVTIRVSSGDTITWRKAVEVGILLGHTNSVQAEAAAMAHAVLWGLKAARGSLVAEDLVAQSMFKPWV